MRRLCPTLLRLLLLALAACKNQSLPHWLGNNLRNHFSPVRAVTAAIILAGHFAVAQELPSRNSTGIISNIATLIRVAQPAPEAAYQIQLEGLVWFVDSTRQSLVLGDASGAAQLAGDWIGPLPQPGQRIRVSGAASIAATGVAFQIGRQSPLIDNTGLRAISEKSRSVYLEAGLHPIELNYFIINGINSRAELDLTYEGPEISRQRIPDANLFPVAGASGRGLQCQYYEGFWENLPDFATMSPVKTGRTKNFDFSLAGPQPDQCGLQFRGQIKIARAGKYTFYLRSRDGSRLMVGRPPLRWEALGQEAFPPPRSIAIGQLLENTNRFWAEVEGNVSFATARPDGGVSLELCDGAGCLRVEITDSSLSVAELAQRSIRVRGYCESALDSYGRKIAGLMLVPSRKEIEWLGGAGANTTFAQVTNSQPPLLTTIQSIRRLKPEVARAELPLKVRGVVTCVQVDLDAFTIQDLTGGLYVFNSPETRSALPELREFVEIEGVTSPGTAQARKITRLGWGLMPEPVRPAWDQLMSGSLDTQFVEIRGVIDRFYHRKNGWSRVEFRTRDGTIAVDLRRAGIKPGTLEEYQGAVIRLRGCLFGSWDLASGRIKVAHIRMSDVEVFVDEPAGLDLFSLPTQRVTHLTRFDPEADVFRRAKITGQVIFVSPREYFVLDGEEGARLTISGTPEFQEGDLVEAVGFPYLGGGSLRLDGIVARKIGHAPLPAPKRLSGDALISPMHDATRIRIEGTLARVKTSTNELVLEVQVGAWRLVSCLNTLASTAPALQAGSTLELTGIYSIEGGQTVMGRDFAPVNLLLTSPADIRVLATPPWWTLRRLTYVVGGLGFMAAVMFLWVTQLRYKVEERTIEVKTLNKDLQDRALALEMANKELESFSYSVSHDLRAPLRSIDGFSRAVQEDYADKLDNEGKENLQTIRAASQRMGQLIDDMLMLAKVARTEIRRAPFDLSNLAGSVAQELRATNPTRRVEFVIAPDLMAEGDASLTRIALENLLGNAWKFTADHPNPRIEFGRTSHNGHSAFFVRDNGAGFDMTYAHKLFGAFQRLHTTAEFPGTGVGLASTQRIIHRQGGRIWAESQPGQGATFYFTLATEKHP
jgi:signal transduction histidine kinase